MCLIKNPVNAIADRITKTFYNTKFLPSACLFDGLQFFG